MEKKEMMGIVNGEGSKSGKMLKLYGKGMEIREIAKVMGVRYNFVYNVVSNDCLKKNEEVRVNKKNGSVKNGIIELVKSGKSNNDIVREMGVNKNYVYKVKKEWELVKDK